MTRLRKWVKQNWTHIDIVLAFGGGLLVSILGLLDAIEGDQLTQATVAVVAVLAFSLLHDRVSRERRLTAVETKVGTVGTRITDAITKLDGRVNAMRQAFQESTGEFAYEHVAWAGHGTFRTKRFLSVRPKEISGSSTTTSSRSPNEHGPTMTRSSSTGGGRPGNLVPLQRPEEPLRDGQGRAIWVVALDRPWKRGEEMRVQTIRKLRDAFSNPIEEYVTVGLDHPTERLKITEIWPSTKPPNEIWLERSSVGESSRTEIALDDLVERSGRKALVDREVPSLRLGETIKLTWRW